MILSIVGYTIFFLSVALNIVAIWYIREMIRELNFFRDKFIDLRFVLENYRKHIKGVHELEMFFGDPTLGGLMQHTRDLSEDLEEYINIFPLEETDFLKEEDENEEE